MNRMIRAYGLLILLTILAGMELALLVKMNVGVGPWDAMALSFSFLTLVFPIEWSLREGTIISMVLFGPLLGIFMPRIEKLYEKWDLVDGKSQIEKEIEGLE